MAMTDIPEVSRNRLLELGYLVTTYSSSSEWELAYKAAVDRFQRNHGQLFTGAVEGHHGRAATFDGTWGDVSEKLLHMPRDCSCPDIARYANGTEIAEARWPPSCALELQFSANFIDRGMPGLTSAETRNCILVSLAQLNTMFDLEPDGTIQEVVLREFVRLGGDLDVDIYVLAVGTITHEIMHAMGGNHTPNDPDSVLYPSMRGQYILNHTDVRTFEKLDYSKARPLRIVLVFWQGDRGTEIWSKLAVLRGSTLAWSFLSTGSCSQRAEQAYDSTVTWNKTRINLPPLPPPDPPPDPPGAPDKPKVLLTYTAKAGEVITVVSGEPDEGGGFEW